MDASSPEQSNFVFYSVLLLGLTASILSNLVTVYVAFRRRPPLDRELRDIVEKFDERMDKIAADFASAIAQCMPRSECGKLMDVQDRKRGTVYEQMNSRFAAGDKQFTQIERALGRIEGKLEELSRRGSVQ